MTIGFLSLPVELRLKIYQPYLQESIIRIPGPQSDPSVLALLLACHTIRNEAFPLVPSTVTFSIYCTEHMIYFLSSLPPETLQSLRHITVWATPLGFYETYPKNFSFRTRFFPSIIPAFPGLQLDTLTIRDPFHGPLIKDYPPADFATGLDLEDLLRYGRGWKELRYFSPNRWFLDTLMRERHGVIWPKQWDDELKKRDRKNSGASVEILLGREIQAFAYTPHSYGRYYATWDDSDSDSEKEDWELEEDEDIKQERARDKLAKSKMYPIDPSDVRWEGVDEMASWREEDYTVHETQVPDSGTAGEQRPVVVVARRGEGVDIVEDGSGIGEGLKHLLDIFNGDWKRMKRKDALVSGHRDPTSKL